MQELQALTRQLQRELRTMDRRTSNPADLSPYFGGLASVLPLHQQCQELCQQQAGLPSSGVPDPLTDQAELALEAAAAAQACLSPPLLLPCPAQAGNLMIMQRKHMPLLDSMVWASTERYVDILVEGETGMLAAFLHTQTGRKQRILVLDNQKQRPALYCCRCTCNSVCDHQHCKVSCLTLIR